MPIALPTYRLRHSRRHLRQRQNDNLEQQAQALFRSWFIDFNPFKEGKFAESELGMIPEECDFNPFKEGKFAESELGMIPEEWRVGNFMDLISVGSGGTPKTDVLEYWNGKIPFFSPKDTSTPVFTHSTEKYITDSGLAKCNSQLYPRNTVFITARGTVGKVRMAGCDMAMNQSNYALISKIAGAEYFIYLYTLELIERIVKKANGAVFSAITVKDFNEPIIIAPQRVLADFLAIVKPIFEMIHKNGLENRNLAELRDSLLPKLMSGELKIEEMNR